MPSYSLPLLEWHFRGHCYTPLRLHYTLHRSPGHTGSPSTDVRVAGVEIWLDNADLQGPPVQALHEYILDRYMRRSSLVLVRQPTTGQVFRRLEIEDAHCTALLERLDPGNPEGLPALLLKLNLSPAKLRMDGMKVQMFSLFPDGWPTTPAL